MRAYLRQLPAGARDRLWRLVGGRNWRLSHRLRRLRHSFSRHPLPGWRAWNSDLSFSTQWAVKEGTVRHSWRGIPMLKHPIEIALYPLLFWHANPVSIPRSSWDTIRGSEATLNYQLSNAGTYHLVISNAMSPAPKTIQLNAQVKCTR